GLRIAPDRRSEHFYDTLGGAQLADHHLQERRLAGAVRSEEARDAARHAQRHVVDRDDLAVPFGRMLALDEGRAHDATTSTAESRLRRSANDPATRSATNAAEIHTGSARSPSGS